MDKKDKVEMNMAFTKVKEYELATHRWKAPLAAKARAKERRLEREANREPIQE